MQMSTKGTAWIVSGLLAMAVFAVYGQTVNFDFVNYDDPVYVDKNPHVAGGLSAETIAWAMTADRATNWHPLTWLSHALDCQLFGLRAGGHHLTSVLLHAANAVLLFWALWLMTGQLWPGALAAALFAVHPLRVESVAWVAERKDVLSGFCFMLTLLAYRRYVRSPFSWANYLLVAAAFALGLMAKPMLVTLPLVLLLLDYWPLRRFSPFRAPTRSVGRAEGQGARGLGLLCEKIPLLLLSAYSCFVTFIVQTEARGDFEWLPMTTRAANAAVAYVAYLGQFVWPVNLAPLYPHPGDQLPGWKVMGSLVVLAVLTVGAVGWRRRLPWLPVGWFWFTGMLVPVIGLVQVGQHAMADRYTYLPQIGLCIAAAWSVGWAVEHWPKTRGYWIAASVLVLLVLMGRAWHQTTFWRDSQTLWTRALACTSANSTAHVNLGAFLVEQGRTAEAVAHYRKALEIRPRNADAHTNLGALMAAAGRVEQAVAHYRQAIEINPGSAETHFNLGVAMARLGNTSEAISHYQNALRIDPDLVEAHANLGGALESQNRTDEAIEHYRAALAMAQRQNKPALHQAILSRLHSLGESPGQRRSTR